MLTQIFKNETKSRKMGSRFFFMYFGDWNSFTLRQKLDSRWEFLIYKRDIKRNIKANILSPPQLNTSMVRKMLVH